MASCLPAPWLGSLSPWYDQAPLGLLSRASSLTWQDSLWVTACCPEDTCCMHWSQTLHLVSSSEAQLALGPFLTSPLPPCSAEHRCPRHPHLSAPLPCSHIQARCVWELLSGAGADWDSCQLLEQVECFCFLQACQTVTMRFADFCPSPQRRVVASFST